MHGVLIVSNWLHLPWVYFKQAGSCLDEQHTSTYLLDGKQKVHSWAEGDKVKTIYNKDCGQKTLYGATCQCQIVSQGLASLLTLGDGCDEREVEVLENTKKQGFELCLSFLKAISIFLQKLFFI